jgi:peroxiredoxin
LDLREVQKNILTSNKLGATVFAISPQSPDNALTVIEKNQLEFEVLSDVNQEVIKAFQLQFDPGEDYHNRRDLTKVTGNRSKLLPVPATFIINQSSTIKASHVEANYTERMRST